MLSQWMLQDTVNIKHYLSPHFCLMFVFFVLCLASGKGKQNHQMSVVDDAVYNALFRLTKGAFDVPLKIQSAQLKVACIRYWSNQKQFRIKDINGEEKLSLNEKAVLKKSELKSQVTKEFKHCKGLGSRKLKHRLSKTYLCFYFPVFSETVCRLDGTKLQPTLVKKRHQHLKLIQTPSTGTTA